MPSCVVSDGRKQDHSRAGMRRSGIGEQDDVGGREAELRAGEHVGHGLRVVDRAVEVLEGPKLAATVGAAGRMFCRCSRGLIGIDADEQRSLCLGNSQRTGEDARPRQQIRRNALS